MIGLFADPEADLAGIARLRKALAAEGAVLRVIASHGGTLGQGRTQQVIERTLLTTRSVEFDAIVVAAGSPGFYDVKLTVLLQEAFRHCKALGAWGDGAQVLENAGIDTSAPGIVLGDKANDDLIARLIDAVGKHRAWGRAALVMASGAPVTE